MQNGYTSFILSVFGILLTFMIFYLFLSKAHIGEAKLLAETLCEEEGLTYINGYDDPPIMAGAGTIGIEIIDDVPCVDAVVVPVGGAGKWLAQYTLYLLCFKLINV
jgi:hypothetical protein